MMRLNCTGEIQVEEPLVIFGAGGHARVVIEVCRASGQSVKVILDDHPAMTTLMGAPVFREADAPWKEMPQFRFLVAVGSNTARARIFEQLLGRGGTPATAIHPFTSISPSASIGAGTVIMAGVVVNAGAIVQENCILNTGCRVDHDCQIEANVHLCPGVTLAGTVRVGRNTMIGTGSSCIPGVSVGKDVTIGAGSVVVRDIPDDVVAYGNPARPRRKLTE